MKFGFINTSKEYNPKPCSELTSEDIGKDVIIFRADGVMFYGKLESCQYDLKSYQVKNFNNRTWAVTTGNKFDYDINKVAEQIQKAYE